jgi:osmotically-inducible protein OsmY
MREEPMETLNIDKGARDAQARVPAADQPLADADALDAAVMNALHWDFAVPRHRVAAHCEKGWVTLTGEVDRPYQRGSAEAAARRVSGVLGVTNEIAVKPRAGRA